jgi:hypothetical protein
MPYVVITLCDGVIDMLLYLRVHLHKESNDIFTTISILNISDLINCGEISREVEGCAMDRLVERFTFAKYDRIDVNGDIVYVEVQRNNCIRQTGTVSC